jgi:hypothetical protein
MAPSTNGSGAQVTGGGAAVSSASSGSGAGVAAREVQSPSSPALRRGTRNSPYRGRPQDSPGVSTAGGGHQSIGAPPSRNTTTPSTLGSTSAIGGAPSSLAAADEEEDNQEEESSEVPSTIVSRKRTNEKLTNEYTCIDGSFKKGGTFECAHCLTYRVKWKTWNASRAMAHLLKCSRVPLTVAQSISGTSQEAQKKQRQRIMSQGATSGATSLEAAQNRLRDHHPPPQIKRSSSVMVEHVRPNIERSSLTRETAERIIMAQVEASLKRFEPPARICDPFVQTALASACGKGILPHIPSAPLVMSRYVRQIDESTEKYLNDTLNRMPGNITVAFDGVTVNGHSNILYTCSKGECQNLFSIILYKKLTQLTHCSLFYLFIRRTTFYICSN